MRTYFTVIPHYQNEFPTGRCKTIFEGCLVNDKNSKEIPIYSSYRYFLIFYKCKLPKKFYGHIIAAIKNAQSIGQEIKNIEYLPEALQAQLIFM